MDVVGQAIAMVAFFSAAPVGAWYTNRHPAVRNDTWGGALGFFLSWLGFLLAVALCAWRARRVAHPAADRQG